MSQFDKAASVLRDIAVKAVDEKTGTFNEKLGEYKSALERASADIDALKADVAKEREAKRFSFEMEHKEKMAHRKSVLSPVLREFVKTGNVNADILKKADGYVRFQADSAGVLLLQPEMANEINRKVLEYTPIMNLVDVQTISGPSFKQPIQTNYITAYWVEEEEAPTLSKDLFAEREITPFGLGARYYYNQFMLDDSAYDIEAYTMQSITEQLTATAGTAIMSGNGVKKPLGMVENVDSYDSGSLTLSFNQLIRVKGEVKSLYYKLNPDKSAWVANRQTIALMRSLAISSTAVQYAWEIDAKAENPERLLGLQVAEAAEGDMASPSAAGAYTSGQKPILVGNFAKAYTVARKPEMHIIRDPYTGSANLRVFTTVVQRIDGRVTQSEAVHALRMAT